ncbi:MAG: BrnA antitoxin family protein [Desulfobacterales bacterium]|jgi:predicted DNA binding CopG/RHH family protein
MKKEGTKDMKRKKLPNFKTEQEEREFWDTHSSEEYVNWNKVEVINAPFPKLKPSTKTISIRLPETMLEELKSLANKNDVPYQSLIKIYLAERIVQETAS